MAKKTKVDWDNVVIQINTGDKAVSNIRMKKSDIETMMKTNEASLGEVLEMMVKTLETTEKPEKPA